MLTLTYKQNSDCFWWKTFYFIYLFFDLFYAIDMWLKKNVILVLNVSPFYEVLYKKVLNEYNWISKNEI